MDAAAAMGAHDDQVVDSIGCDRQDRRGRIAVAKA